MGIIYLCSWHGAFMLRRYLSPTSIEVRSPPEQWMEITTWIVRGGHHMDSGWRLPRGRLVEAKALILEWRFSRTKTPLSRTNKKEKKVNQKKNDVEAVVVQAEFRFQVDRSLGGGGAVCGWTRSKTEEYDGLIDWSTMRWQDGRKDGWMGRSVRKTNG